MWSDPRQIMTGEPKGFPESLDVKHKSTEGDPQVFWPEQAEEWRCHHRLTRRETEVRVREDRGHTAEGRLSDNQAGPTSRAPGRGPVDWREEHRANCGGVGCAVGGDREELRSSKPSDSGVLGSERHRSPQRPRRAGRGQLRTAHGTQPHGGE